VALAYEGAPMGLVSTVGREGAGQGAPPAPGRLFSSYRAPRGFGVFGHPCAKVLMGQWLFDTIPSKLDVEGSSPFSRSSGPSSGRCEYEIRLSQSVVGWSTGRHEGREMRVVLVSWRTQVSSGAIMASPR